VITGELSLGIAEVLQVERLVPEARSAEEPNGRTGTGQLGIPAVRSAAGTFAFTRSSGARRGWAIGLKM
jgi:hypothetical protein